MQHKEIKERCDVRRNVDCMSCICNICPPISRRLGIESMRHGAVYNFHNIDTPEICFEIGGFVKSEKAIDEACMVIIKKAIIEMLRQNGISAVIMGRVKGLRSIYRKMYTSGCSVIEVMDKIGLRIIVNSVPDCYRVLGILHMHFRPISGTFDDYIAVPKKNGYQSLHTCVFPLKDISRKPVEIQIRTLAMHRDAELGRAAHWRYKIASEARSSVSRQPSKHRCFLFDHAHRSGSEDFVERLSMYFFGRPIVEPVGSNGDRRDLPLQAVEGIT